MTNNTLFDAVDIPEDEINTVLEWVQSEQVRIINKDRTFSSLRSGQVDWITELRSNLSTIRNHTTADNKEILRKNEIIQARIDREIFDKAQAETLRILSEKSTHKKVCRSFVECTCRDK